MEVSQLLNNLITKLYYANKEVITNKVNFFFALNQVSEEDYSALMLLIEENYQVVENTEEAEEA